MLERICSTLDIHHPNACASQNSSNKQQLGVGVHQSMRKSLLLYLANVVNCTARKVLEDFCVAWGLANVEFLEEIGGGMNFGRKKFLALMDAVESGAVETLVVAHKDRLTRFGYEWFERFGQQPGCEILGLNQEQLSPEEELVQDLLTIPHVFSARLCGLRNYRKQLQEAIHADVSAPDSARTDAGSNPVL